MAEPDYSSPYWAAFSTGPGPQGSEMPAPLLPGHAPSFAQGFPSLSYEPPYHQVNAPPMPPFSEVHAFAFYTHTPGRSPYPMPVAHPPHMRPYPQPHSRLPPALRNGSAGGRMDSPSLSDTGDNFPRVDPSIPRGTQAFFPAYFAGHEPLLPPANGPSPMARRYHYPIGPPAPPALSSDDQDRMQAPNRGNIDQHQRTPSLNPRSSHVEQPPHNNRPYMHPERRSTALFNPQGRRSDRSVSPRTSTRRSFDRYSSDFSPSITSSDAEEGALRAAPSNRARHRPREVRPRFLPQRQDPNIPSLRQIQDLKDKLPRRLPSELPEGASCACDICQKDYSSTYVQPSEEDEIAIQLPCGHSFGEFCIFQWFDTCKTHKNKVTCPMCRKLLIEPVRYSPALLHAISRHGPAFQELLANELRGDFAHT
ncbi:hypothetical protein P153DRAFT_355803 [Dothidotthia symphoricarpi CBS 119687]|uniref:RING-type domain-containing protein n=1 Tax=Dothidotthia symphoricarpi CBS 119687 TaxID=1392245 RepID=A0A6A6AIF7_9PLEO|nr:uncharacterized protein P153DRAFT_355803 [Dothidotthia symphoricarpi CBS 119687]KAF2131013.1 hypothetical protein P153DRAFT_355803 [Dothidotthia symphoricarpi CBS 119687]